MRAFGGWTACRVAISLALAAVFSALSLVWAGEEIVLSNGVLEVRLDGSSGAITQVVDLCHGIELVHSAGVAPAFRVGTPEGIGLAAGDVDAVQDSDFDGTAWDLTWPVDVSGLTVRARIEVPPGEEPARFAVRVASTSGPRIDFVDYPVIGGVGSLGEDPQETELVHPVATGYLIRDPLAHLDVGERFGFYPDAYSGAALQVMAYIEQGVGGFHFQVEDSAAEAKRLACLPDAASGWLEISFRRYSPEAVAGADLVPTGAVILAASETGTWEESADRYREWALAQPWAARGPLRDLPEDERAPWLFEEVGAATFGISVRRDQTAWFTGLHNFLGVPLLHVSGYWWPGGVPGNEWYGGYNDWSGDRVNPANLAAIRDAGDWVALFLFPQHFSRNATEYDEPAPDPATDPIAPWQPYAMDPDPEEDPWSYICPATVQWQEFYGWRAVELMTRHQPDAEYLDIGPGLGRVHCENISHGHPPGWGTPLVEGARAMLDSRRDELHDLRGTYVPRGTELISELYLDRFDYYQARAGAGPLTMLEGNLFRLGEIKGWAEKIPLFTWVYHDYGPLRLDGNLKLAPELGELFFWVAARVALWGGVPELNYELSALERLPGMIGPTWFETYRPDYDCKDLSPYDASSDRADALAELADLRSRRGREFLVFGRMRRAARFAGIIPQVSLDWHLYNTFQREFTCPGGIEIGAEYHSHGRLTVPAVLSTGWSAPYLEAEGDTPLGGHQKVGLTLAEVGGDARSVSLELDPQRQGVFLLNFLTTVLRRDGEQDEGMHHPGDLLDLSFDPHEAVLVRLDPSPCEEATCLYRVFRGPDPAVLAASDAIAEVEGHAYSDDTAGDGLTWFYLVDDGGGFPVDSLRLARTATIDLTW